MKEIANLETAELMQLSCSKIVPSSANPRRSSDQAALIQLADDITRRGVLQPIWVRPGEKTGEYILIAGWRRWQAAQEAGLTTIPALVMDVLEEEALELAVIENLQREDVHPLDEAEAYCELMKHSGASVTTVAAKVAKDVAYVTRRLKLASLLLRAREAFLNRLVTLDHALLLAKLGAEEQEKALRYVLNSNAKKSDLTGDLISTATAEMNDPERWRPFEVGTPSALKYFIEHELALDLAKAPWDLADETLMPGSCINCPNRTGANDALFGDLTVKEATCMDAACYEDKRKAFIERSLVTIAKAGTDAVKVSFKFSSNKAKLAKDGDIDHVSGFARNQVFKHGQWIAAKSKDECPTVVMGVAVDYQESFAGEGKPGDTQLVCLNDKCKVHHKQEKAKSGGERYDPEVQRKRQEELERNAREETQIRAGNVVMALEHVKKLTPEIVRALALQAAPNFNDELVKQLAGKDFKSRLQTAATESAAFARIAVVLMVDKDIPAKHWDSEQAQKQQRTKLFNTLKALTGFDAAAHAKAREKKFGKASPVKKTKPAPKAKKAAKKGGR